MRGPSKSVPKYRKHKASGKAVVTINGKDFYLGPYNSKASKIEYDRLIGEWLASGRSAFGSAHNGLTINQLIASYWAHCKEYYVKNGRPTDEQAGIRVCLRYLRTFYGRQLAESFGPLSLESIRNRMIEAKNSRRYINQNIGRIKRVFRWAASKEWVPVHVYQSLLTLEGLKKGKCKAKETSPVLPIDEASVERTIQQVSQVVGDMIRVQVLTGCRPGELFIMRPCDIERSGDVWKYVPESHKTEHRGRQRVILIGPQAQEILLPYLLKSADDLCFRTPRNRPFNRGRYHKLIAYGCKKAGIPAWAPNRLRHLAATKIRASYGIEASQVILGHSKIETTQIYAERDISRAESIMREVG